MRRLMTGVLAVAMFAFFSAESSGQSGRRLPKGRPAPAPMPEPESTPLPKPPPKPDFTLKVVAEISQDVRYRFFSARQVQAWAVERLRRSTLLDVRDAGEMNRRQAIDQARSETEAFVVLLQFQDSPFGWRENAGRSRVQDAWIDVTVYNPVTAKTKASRRLALGQNSTRINSRSILQACYPGIFRDDLLVLEATIEAADFVMNAFRVPLPPICRGGGPI